MARVGQRVAVDLSQPHEINVGMIERLRCPEGKSQAFLRDSKAPSLRVRVTAQGAKSFVFEAKLNRETVRRTIGDVRSWKIDAARAEANKLRVLIDSGTDPRELERQQEALRTAKREQAAVEALTVADAWMAYIEARTPFWGERHLADHVAKAKAGGEKARRGTRGRGETIAGPLHTLMEFKLGDLTPSTVAAWAAEQSKTRPTSTRLSWRLLKGFLSWCAEHDVYSKLLPAGNAAKTRTVREVLGRSKVKQDALQREQLRPWFTAIRQLPNTTAAAYLQALLLTGARPGELLELRWSDVNTKWKCLTIRDKVDGERVIPLTPFVSKIIEPLPHVNEWVFASPSMDDDLRDKPMSKPHKAHAAACAVAGLEGLTLHGLRRSFKSLTEWLELPVGVVAQLMGHKPSATAEKHYTVRPLDLLRLHHERIEHWIISEAGLSEDGDSEASPSKRGVPATAHFRVVG